MAALLDNEDCSSCRKSHDLYLADDDYFSAAGRYEYECPATGQRTVIRPSAASRIVQSPPSGALLSSGSMASAEGSHT
jgi:hypothetical protein